MIFNSLTFLLFCLVFFGIYYFLTHRRQNLFLLLASYFFYGWWDWRFLGLLLFSTVLDYWVGRAIGKSTASSTKKALLSLSLLSNLGLLGFFKYCNFFVEQFESMASQIGWHVDPFTLHIILPVGISFYTFQTLSYTIDIYRGHLEPTKDFLNFAVFVSFFPQLVAGPIERASHLLPFIENQRTITSKQVETGLWLILVGFFKKIVIADQCAAIVNVGFSGSPMAFEHASPWVYVVFFAFQIYGDFSGYSDIARGLSKLLGIELIINFKRPYLVTSIPEIWTNWHISLSSWLRDYLYIPLGGNRCGKIKQQRNLMTTMLLGGLWHGAGWAYIIWGAYHGILLVISHTVGIFSSKPPSLQASKPPSLQAV